MFEVIGMAFKYINPGYAELLNGTTVTTVRNSFYSPTGGVSFSAEYESIEIIPAGKITSALFCKFDIYCDYDNDYEQCFVGLSGGMGIWFSRHGSCSLPTQAGYYETQIIEGGVSNITLRIRANDSTTGICEMTVKTYLNYTAKTTFSLNTYPIANRPFVINFRDSVYGMFYISNLIISDEEISDKECAVALPINLTSTDMTENNGLYTATAADQTLLQTPNVTSLIENYDINSQVAGIMVAGNPAYKTAAQSTSLISLSKENNVITEHNSCELSEDTNAKIADGWRITDMTITDLQNMQFGRKTNGNAVIKPDRFIFASIAPQPEISLCVRHDGGIISCPLKYSKTLPAPALAVRHEDKIWCNRLVAPNDERAGDVHLRLGNSVYALSDTKFSGSYTPAGVSKLWFPFTEAVTYDVFENGIERYQGSPEIENGKLKLDGYSYIQSKTAGIGGQDFTIDCWAQMDRFVSSLDTYHHFFNCPNFIEIMQYKDSKNQIQVIFEDSDTETKVYCCFALPEPLTTRFHIAVVYQHTEELLKIYFNGSSVFDRKWKFETHTDNRPLTIGGNALFSNNQWEGTIEHFRYIDGLALWTEDFTPPDKLAEYIVQMGVTPAWNHTDYGVRFDGDTWVYSNEGTANLLAAGGKTLTDLPETQSRTGTAFYQTEQVKSFPIPKTKEIWAKFDAYFDGNDYWSVLNETEVFNEYGGFKDYACGIGTLSNTDGTFVAWQGERGKIIKTDIFKTNTLQTFLLHMVSDLEEGVIETWCDGELLYRYEGEVNRGEIFDSFCFWSSGAGAFFSNVTVSNVEIALN